MPTTIAAVIVNWNKKEFVLNLLNDLQKVKDPLFDIFVVDNASTDGSPEAIKAGHPDVTLIINDKNLGGTGGFNTGITHVCRFSRYDYIWLLDNDVIITETALSELINIMKSDDQIGLVGSRVMDIEDSTVTVEAGANIRWDVMGTKPVHRNTAKEITDSPIVDYVAICSALVNIKALNAVGIMDDRLFLLWDDMEWGICFNEKGYKVVAASRSIVYHASFTERDRGAATYFYYGIRNPLLVYSKHTTFAKRLKVFYRSLRYICRTYLFLKSHDKMHEAGLIYQALSDFINNRWGRLSIANNTPPASKDQQATDRGQGKEQIKKILLSSNSLNTRECKRIIKSLQESYPGAETTLLVQDDRIDYFKEYRMLVFNREKIAHLFYAIRESIAIKRERFDAIAFTMPTPLIYLGKNMISFNKDGTVLSQNPTPFFSITKLCVWIIHSELTTLIMLPVILYKSLGYHSRNR
jgi:GT2 family glycosyltransferase